VFYHDPIPYPLPLARGRGAYLERGFAPLFFYILSPSRRGGRGEVNLNKTQIIADAISKFDKSEL